MKKSISVVLLPFVLAFLFSGCGGMDDSNGIVMSLLPTRTYGEYLVGDNNQIPFVNNHWSKAGESFMVFVEQDGKYAAVGKVNTIEKEIAKEDQNTFVNIRFITPKAIDRSRPFNVIAFDKDVEVSLSGNTLVCNAGLKRNINHIPGWYLADAKAGTVSSAQGRLLSSYECVWITNKTGLSIKVKHKGWENATHLYYTDAEVHITSQGEIVSTIVGQSSGSDPDSVAKTIESGNTEFIQSCFVPTGETIIDSVLVLEIDGKTVKTTPISLGPALKNGVPYFCSVEWNGSTLKWN